MLLPSRRLCQLGVDTRALDSLCNRQAVQREDAFSAPYGRHRQVTGAGLHQAPATVSSCWNPCVVNRSYCAIAAHSVLKRNS